MECRGQSLKQQILHQQHGLRNSMEDKSKSMSPDRSSFKHVRVINMVNQIPKQQADLAHLKEVNQRLRMLGNLNFLRSKQKLSRQQWRTKVNSMGEPLGQQQQSHHYFQPREEILLNLNNNKISTSFMNGGGGVIHRQPQVFYDG